MTPEINDLPVELLVDILRYLDQSQLKSAILACKKWKEIIERYCTWSVDFERHDIHNLVRPLRHTKRRYRKIVFFDFYCHRVENGMTHLDKGYEFLELLKCLPNLEEICARWVVIEEVTDDCSLPDLKKLKTLRASSCNINFFKCFRTSNLISLELKAIDFFPKNSSQDMANFVRRQKNLTTLIVTAAPDLFFQLLSQTTPNGAMPFKLKTLIVDAVFNSIGLYHLIKNQSKTLQKLDLCRCISISTCEFVINEIKDLKFLALSRLPEETQFANCLKINTNVVQLQLRFNNFSPRTLRRLCQSVPNVKKLALQPAADMSAERLYLLSSRLSNITTLHVDRFDGNLSKITFPNVSSFHIEILTNEEVNWDAFTKANRRISEIAIKRVVEGCLSLDHIETITRNLKLEIFKIGRGFSTDERFLSIIHNNCLNLKVLDLHKSCGIKDLRWNESCATPLRLCDEIFFSSSFRTIH